MKKVLMQLACDDTGIAGAEYAFLAALIAAALASEVTTLGERVKGFYTTAQYEYQAVNR